MKEEQKKEKNEKEEFFLEKNLEISLLSKIENDNCKRPILTFKDLNQTEEPN